MLIIKNLNDTSKIFLERHMKSHHLERTTTDIVVTIFLHTNTHTDKLYLHMYIHRILYIYTYYTINIYIVYMCVYL